MASAAPKPPLSLVEQDLCHRLTTKLMRLDALDAQRRDVMSDIQADSKALALERRIAFIRIETLRQELGVEQTQEQR